MKTPDLSDGPWSGVESVHGLAVDELVSALHKSIRLGNTENAALVATEMFLTSSELEDHLWRRLEIISVEDVGLGDPISPAHIAVLESLRRRAAPRGPDRLIFAVHAVRILAESQKDRTSAELAAWATEVLDRGTRLPEIPESAIDFHTRRGRELGRGYREWFTTGAVVENEIPNRDLKYRERLFELLNESED
jgi:replication-associated recombination protein RarA